MIKFIISITFFIFILGTSSCQKSINNNTNEGELLMVDKYLEREGWVKFELFKDLNPNCNWLFDKMGAPDFIDDEKPPFKGQTTFIYLKEKQAYLYLNTSNGSFLQTTPRKLTKNELHYLNETARLLKENNELIKKKDKLKEDLEFLRFIQKNNQ